MADCFISEYSSLGSVAGGSTLPLEPAIATQKFTFTAATSSAAFNERTRLIRIQCNAAAYLLFGIAPTATTSHMPLSANVYDYFAVSPGDKVSVLAA